MAEYIIANFETGADGDNTIGDAAGTDYAHARKFTIASDANCSAASTYIRAKTGAPTGDLTFRIETNVSSKPSGTLAHANATGIVANASIATAAWNKADFTPFTLSAGTYWLTFVIPNQSTNVNWLQSRDNNGTGQGAYSSDAGASWTLFTANTYVGYFRVYELEADENTTNFFQMF